MFILQDNNCQDHNYFRSHVIIINVFGYRAENQRLIWFVLLSIFNEQDYADDDSPFHFVIITNSILNIQNYRQD